MRHSRHTLGSQPCNSWYNQFSRTDTIGRLANAGKRSSREFNRQGIWKCWTTQQMLSEMHLPREIRRFCIRLCRFWLTHFWCTRFASDFACSGSHTSTDTVYQIHFWCTRFLPKDRFLSTAESRCGRIQDTRRILRDLERQLRTRRRTCCELYCPAQSLCADSSAASPGAISTTNSAGSRTPPPRPRLRPSRCRPFP